MTTSDIIAVSPRAEEMLAGRLRQAGSICSFQRGETLARAEGANDCVHIVATGFAVAVKRTPDGLQQNVALYLAGDIVGHEIVTLGSLRCDAVALTQLVTHRVPISALREAFDSDRDHAAAFFRHAAFHGTLAQEWLLNLGRRPAYARTAHFLCEIIHRTGIRGETETTACPMPLTQTELADTLGLSVVHVNRVLMRLKDEGLIRLRRGHVEVLNWSRFKTAAGFDPSYLVSRA